MKGNNCVEWRVYISDNSLAKETEILPSMMTLIEITTDHLRKSLKEAKSIRKRRLRSS